MQLPQPLETLTACSASSSQDLILTPYDRRRYDLITSYINHYFSVRLVTHCITLVHVYLAYF